MSAQARADVIKARRQPVDVTATRYADTLEELVALVEQFGPFTDWTIHAGHSRRAALRWSLLELRVAERTDLALAELVAAERLKAAAHLRATVVAAATDLGLPLSRYYRPAPRVPVNAGLTRCPACRCNTTPDHTPGSDDCRQAAHDRHASQAADE